MPKDSHRLAILGVERDAALRGYEFLLFIGDDIIDKAINEGRRIVIWPARPVNESKVELDE